MSKGMNSHNEYEAIDAVDRENREAIREQERERSDDINSGNDDENHE